jgi:hypothetical protein
VNKKLEHDERADLARGERILAPARRRQAP